MEAWDVHANVESMGYRSSPLCTLKGGVCPGRAEERDDDRAGVEGSPGANVRVPRTGRDDDLRQ